MTMMQKLNSFLINKLSTKYLPSSELSELMSNAVCIRLVRDLGDVGVWVAGGGVFGVSGAKSSDVGAREGGAADCN